MARVNDLAGGALFEEHEGLGGWSDDVEVATPVFLPLTHVSGTAQHLQSTEQCACTDDGASPAHGMAST
jgi:hypothetical protein